MKNEVSVSQETNELVHHSSIAHLGKCADPHMEFLLLLTDFVKPEFGKLLSSDVLLNEME